MIEESFEQEISVKAGGKKSNRLDGISDYVGNRRKMEERNSVRWLARMLVQSSKNLPFKGNPDILFLCPTAPTDSLGGRVRANEFWRLDSVHILVLAFPPQRKYICTALLHIVEFPTDIMAIPPQFDCRISVRKNGENHATTRFLIIEKRFQEGDSFCIF
jgi:hypothetical protein